MIIDHRITDNVKQLRRAGLRPPERLAGAILKAGRAAFQPLLELATDVELLHEDEPECYAPIHALRLLNELGALEIIEPLLGKLPLDLYYEDEKLPQIWVEELPQIIGRLGAPALEPLWRIVGDPGWHLAARSSALIALTYVTAVAPETREPVVAGLRERLVASDDKAFASHIVIALANLGVSAMYAEIMNMYRSGQIDQDVVSAGAVRQLLLRDSSKRFACAKHPLWERYDQHGPFREEDEM